MTTASDLVEEFHKTLVTKPTQAAVSDALTSAKCTHLGDRDYNIEYYKFPDKSIIKVDTTNNIYELSDVTDTFDPTLDLDVEAEPEEPEDYYIEEDEDEDPNSDEDKDPDTTKEGRQ